MKIRIVQLFKDLLFSKIILVMVITFSFKNQVLALIMLPKIGTTYTVSFYNSVNLNNDSIKIQQRISKLIKRMGYVGRESEFNELVKIGKPAIIQLINCMKADSEGMFWKIRTAGLILGEIGDVQAVEPLIECLADKKYTNGFREAAAYALGGIGDSRAVVPLIECLSRKYGEGTNRAAIVALSRIGDRRAVDPLLESLSEDPYNYRVAKEALEKMSDNLFDVQVLILSYLDEGSIDDNKEILSQLFFYGYEKQEGKDIDLNQPQFSELKELFDRPKRIEAQRIKRINNLKIANEEIIIGITIEEVLSILSLQDLERHIFLTGAENFTGTAILSGIKLTVDKGKVVAKELIPDKLGDGLFETTMTPPAGYIKF